jgi:hypothetical protein
MIHAVCICSRTVLSVANLGFQEYLKVQMRGVFGVVIISFVPCSNPPSLPGFRRRTVEIGVIA